jgi:hypothetical protein
MKIIISSIITLVAASAFANASISFTVYGTANNTILGYNAGELVEFTFLIHNYSPNAPAGNLEDNEYNWTDSSSTDPMLFSSVVGTGLTGIWNRPTEPNDNLVAGGDFFGLIAEVASGSNGLMVNGFALDMLQIDATYDIDFIRGTSLPDPNQYLSGYVGNYDATATDTFNLIANGQTATFTATSLRIVPEPSQIVLTCLAGGILITRRRR